MEGEMDEATASQSVKYGQEVSFMVFWLPAAEKCNTQCRGVSVYSDNFKWQLSMFPKN